MKKTPVPESRFLKVLAAMLASLLFSFQNLMGTPDPEILAILAKARSYVGEESVLNNVKSLRFIGTITTANGEEGGIEIHLRTPYQQLQILSGNGVVQEFGLNDYEAWKKVYRSDNPEEYNLIPSNPDQLKRVRANTFENLKFFSSDSNYQRKLEYLGRETISGELVERVKVVYGSMYYIRNFKASTGQLILTEIETGEQIQESGEIKVSGIKFPKTLISLIDGKEVHRISFDSVEVNPVFDDSLFAQPALPGIRKK
ncbi:MAG: hypothetical protein O3C43_00310 [Verrucomicrobia bacterium]|nr:hypothetical protein [Verrucomicrobiota bacterium]MDA1064921.1 hypothetical protein [Verrucomicrobiota bacterium]